MEDVRSKIEERLLTIVHAYKDSTVKNAMKYSLLAGGKRIRPRFFIEVIRSYGYDYAPYLDIACAIEMIHTYSLIHDDLPGMDNDDYRRGKLTCHKQYDEATAILAGDSLLNEAMNVILKLEMDPTIKIEVLRCLFEASGLNGMIYGQQLDMKYENTEATIEQLNEVHLYKTGALISASLKLGALLIAKEDAGTWERIGQTIGLAFQIQDDILDVIGNHEVLGKTVGSDINNGKTTYVSLLGVERSQQQVEMLFTKAIAELYSLPINHGLLLDMIETLRKRVS